MQSFNQLFALTNDYVYITRTTNINGTAVQNVATWSGVPGSLATVGGGVNAIAISVIPGKSTKDFYIGGTFTTVGSPGIVANRVAYFDGNNTWNTLGGTTPFNGNVTQLAYDKANDLLYVGSHATTTLVNRIAVYNGTTWTGIAEGTVNGYCKFALDESGNLYVGYNGVFKRYNKVGGTWTTLSAYIGGVITQIYYHATTKRMYIALESATNNIRYWDIENSTLNAVSPAAPVSCRGITVNAEGELIVAGISPSGGFINSIVRLQKETNQWVGLYNYQDTVGALGVHVDELGNIYTLANSGGATVGERPYGVGNWGPVNAAKSIVYGGPIVIGALNGQSGGDPHIQPLLGPGLILDNAWTKVLLYKHKEYTCIGNCELLPLERALQLHKLRGGNVSQLTESDRYATTMTYFVALTLLHNETKVAELNLLTGELVVHDTSVRGIQELAYSETGLYSLTHQRAYEQNNYRGFRVHLGVDNLMVSIDNYWDDINHMIAHVANIADRSGELIKHDEANKLN